MIVLYIGFSQMEESIETCYHCGGTDVDRGPSTLLH